MNFYFILFFLFEIILNSNFVHLKFYTERHIYFCVCVCVCVFVCVNINI